MPSPGNETGEDCRRPSSLEEVQGGSEETVSLKQEEKVQLKIKFQDETEKGLTVAKTGESCKNLANKDGNSRRTSS